MPPETGRRGFWLTLLGAIVAIVVLGVVLVLARGDAGRPAAARATSPSASTDAAPGAPGGERTEPAARAMPARADEESAAPGDTGPDQDMIALRWAQVDLEALREEMPDNLYWELGAPTSDPSVEEARAERRARWNEAYGKVVSGTATIDEIHAYYDERAQVSTDYLEFATRVLEQYGDILPERDVGLLELSAKMHRGRLQSMPRQVAQAIERKEQQDRLREAWLADEAAFEQRQAEEVERSLR
jgi:predicted transcriptional regulator